MGVASGLSSPAQGPMSGTSFAGDGFSEGASNGDDEIGSSGGLATSKTAAARADRDSGNGSSSLLAVLIGGIVGAVLLCVCVIFVALILIQRRKRHADGPPGSSAIQNTGSTLQRSGGVPGQPGTAESVFRTRVRCPPWNLSIPLGRAILVSPGIGRALVGQLVPCSYSQTGLWSHCGP
jgi:hypothetical protein